MTSVIQGQGKETRDREKYRLLDFVLTSATFVYDPFASASPTLAQVFTLRESRLLAVTPRAPCLMTGEHLFC